jgi:DNA-binding IclR family transcriptional regulator
VAELEKLSINQQNILKALAVMPTDAITGQKFLNQTQLPVSSVRLGMNSLLEKDMVYQIKITGQYRVLDPLLSFSLKKYD